MAACSWLAMIFLSFTAINHMSIASCSIALIDTVLQD